ncbi:RNase J family beta-CASP ribonuclease [Agaricicola taiwanensis]|uniref:RNase J family beta-CASP ribonuclease n=1 Tax=Agaricicola taiwanensis TaxID=591372 RepID=A0A8J3DV16_9RHOB|nr:ribonuclease J [Agaricicola taiwanensis]GGE44222.1 RNase J family beta-CASP ribonuclease [Agaricicola taiwanensis]
MTKADNDLVFVPLGGVGEIGMNLGLYGYGRAGKRNWLMVDCGVTFGDPALTPGIDLIMPDISFIEAERKNLVGIVLTHAHEDHFGALLDLWPRLRVPVAATPFAAALLEAKRVSESGPPAPRPEMRIVPPGSRISFGPFDVEMVSVAHSIPEATALAIRTPAGLVVHTGDWKLDAHPATPPGTDEKRFRELGEEGVLAVVADSTNATRDGRSPSEADVAASLAEIIREAKARVAVTTFASHIGRIRAIAEAALAADRQVVVVGRAMERSINVARETGYLDGIPAFLTPKNYGYIPPDKVVLILTGSQGEPRAALARIAEDTHPEIALSSRDKVIFSSRTIPGNEKAVGRIINGLIVRGVEVITDGTRLVHVSGHPRRGEIAEFYSWLKPAAVVPVHGEALHLHEHATFAKQLDIPTVVEGSNGKMVKLAPGKPEIIGDAPSGRLHKDGRLLLSERDPATAERRKLSFAGAVSVALAMTPKGEVVSDPDVALTGLPEKDGEGESFIDIVRDTALDTLDNLPRARRRDPAFVADVVERAIRAELNQVWGKKPVCHVLVLTV